jgi:hypothetical protein
MIILLVVSVLFGGCINKILPHDSTTETSGKIPSSGNQESESLQQQSSANTITPRQVPAMGITPQKSEIVTEVLPILTPDPYPILHGTRINETHQYRFIDRVPEFEKTYTFRGNATGLLVNVAEGPLYVVYTVKPQNDCLLDPDACRGDMLKPVQRPYLTITVMDNQTQQIVAEDGYGREYSSDTGNYEFIISSENTLDGLTSSSGSIGTNTVYPGPRRIVVYKEGVFHVTIEGNYLDVDLSIITGSSPDPLEVSSEKQSGQSASPTVVPDDEEGW